MVTILKIDIRDQYKKASIPKCEVRYETELRGQSY
jgi:hypothetical protein